MEEVKRSESSITPWIEKQTQLGCKIDFGGEPAFLFYYFDDGALESAGYVFSKQHSDLNAYIDDYNKVKKRLRHVYGKPVKDDVFWSNPLYKDDHKEWGFAIVLEHLKYQVTWKVSPSTIMMQALEGANNKIWHGVKYFSKSALSKSVALPPGMVYISGGVFMMGCTMGDSKCEEIEKPAHEVTVSSFFIDVTEVTVAAYRKCVGSGQCSALPPKNEPCDDISTCIQECNWYQSKREDHPMNCATWFQAKDYCQWVGKRLPTEAEWEYAARGGHSDWKYPWGNQRPSCSRAVMNGWFHGKGCGKDSTWPVGSKGVNGFGLSDMEGNVGEWVEDDYHYYSDAPANEVYWQECKEPPVQEKADLNCDKVMRGGTLYSEAPEIRVSGRWRAATNEREILLCFRCAKSVE